MYYPSVNTIENVSKWHLMKCCQSNAWRCALTRTPLAPFGFKFLHQVDVEVSGDAIILLVYASRQQPFLESKRCPYHSRCTVFSDACSVPGCCWTFCATLMYAGSAIRGNTSLPAVVGPGFATSSKMMHLKPNSTSAFPVNTSHYIFRRSSWGNYRTRSLPYYSIVICEGYVWASTSPTYDIYF